jgi:hypothetical protein
MREDFGAYSKTTIWHPLTKENAILRGARDAQGALNGRCYASSI